MAHTTPSDATWPLFLEVTDTPRDEDDVLGWEPDARPAGMGTYASRRVFYKMADVPDGPRICSTEVIAKDEPQPELKDHLKVDADGTTFYPFSAMGCYNCGADCDRHGSKYNNMHPIEVETP